MVGGEDGSAEERDGRYFDDLAHRLRVKPLPSRCELNESVTGARRVLRCAEGCNIVSTD